MSIAQTALRLLYRVPLIVLVTTIEGIVAILSAVCAELWAVLDLDNTEQKRRQRAKTKQRTMADSILRDIEAL